MTSVRVFITEHNGNRYEVNPVVLTDTIAVNGSLRAVSVQEDMICFSVNSRLYTIEFEGLSREDGPIVREKPLRESIASLEGKPASFPPPPTKHGECGCRECIDTNGNAIVVKG